MTPSGAPVQSAPCTGRGEKHGTGRLGSAPVRPAERQAGRQQRAAVGGEPPGRQAGLGN